MNFPIRPTPYYLDPHKCLLLRAQLGVNQTSQSKTSQEDNRQPSDSLPQQKATAACKHFNNNIYNNADTYTDAMNCPLPELASMTALLMAEEDTVLLRWKISSNSCSLMAGGGGSWRRCIGALQHKLTVSFGLQAAAAHKVHRTP